MKLACVPVLNYFTSDNRVERTCRFLIARGYDVHVLAVGREDLPEYEVRDGMHIHRFRSRARGTVRRGLNLTAARTFGAFLLRGARFLRKEKPDVIHYNDWNTLVLGALAPARSSRTVYDMHELFQDLDYLNFPRPINQVIAWISRLGLRSCEAVICVSDPIREELETLTDKKVYVVRNVPEQRHVDGKGDPALIKHLQDGRKHLVFLGGLQVKKGGLWMLELLSHLPDTFVLDCLSGVTEKNQPFLDEAARLGVTDRVFIHPYVPQDQLYATIRHAWAGLSIFLPASRIYEYALPNKIFEYFLAGLPVISSDARAQAELIDEVGLGLVVPLDDPEGAAALVEAWEPPEVTPEVLQKHGLTWEQEQQRLAQVYDELGLG